MRHRVAYASEAMATVKRDYYEVLGVARAASDDEIRRAFRRLAREHHPDLNKDDGAEGRFKELNEAYEILSDPEKRQRYDAFGHAGVGAGDPTFSTGFGPFADLFESFFGTDLRRERAGPARGSDLRMELEVDFLEAIFGAERKVEVPREQLCSKCGGSGAEPGSKVTRCERCGGSGELRTVQNTFFGRVVNSATCPRCMGEGRVHEQSCVRCEGSGRERIVKQLAISIPAGIADGQQLRLSGEGEAGARGGPPGHLYVLVRVRPHEVFERRGTDILYGLRISPVLAALGGEVEVPTVDGLDRVNVSAGTQHGATLRLRGKGVPRLAGSGRGDEIVVFNVVVPKHLSGKEKKLWQELRAVSSEPERSAEEKSLLGHLKDMLRG